jgi:hypothetical protein
MKILITMYYSRAWYSVYKTGRFVSMHDMIKTITPIITMNAIKAAVVPFQNPSVFMK